ncbi:MAG: hypothetical protein U9N46_12060, partial [Euryarchaeota archaeon]|nr:hypothetical protein [Euryarchaeota archaeon]
ATRERKRFTRGSTYTESQRNNSVPWADINTRPTPGALLMVNHNNSLHQFDCVLRTVLLADSASGASELADLFYVTLACRVKNLRIKPVGMLKMIRNWKNLSGLF